MPRTKFRDTIEIKTLETKVGKQHRWVTKTGMSFYLNPTDPPERDDHNNPLFVIVADRIVEGCDIDCQVHRAIPELLGHDCKYVGQSK